MKTHGEVDVFLTSTLVGGEWSASCPGRFSRLGGHQTWFGQREQGKKILPLQVLELLPLGCPVRTQSIYRLRYPGSRATHYVQITDPGSELHTRNFWMSVQISIPVKLHSVACLRTVTSQRSHANAQLMFSLAFNNTGLRVPRQLPQPPSGAVLLEHSTFTTSPSLGRQKSSTFLAGEETPERDTGLIHSLDRSPSGEANIRSHSRNFLHFLQPDDPAPIKSQMNPPHTLPT
jgi:hypothetical protein